MQKSNVLSRLRREPVLYEHTNSSKPKTQLFRAPSARVNIYDTLLVINGSTASNYLKRRLFATRRYVSNRLLTGINGGVGREAAGSEGSGAKRPTGRGLRKISLQTSWIINKTSNIKIKKYNSLIPSEITASESITCKYSYTENSLLYKTFIPLSSPYLGLGHLGEIYVIF
jgi:hypothetical protein